MYCVTDSLCFGPAITPSTSISLQSLGITHILNCAKEIDDTYIDWAQVLDIGVDDDVQPKDIEWFRSGINFILCAIESQGKVYVHCMGGSNRAPSMVYAALRYMGHEEFEAEQMIRAQRFDAGILYRESAERSVRILKEEKC